MEAALRRVHHRPCRRLEQRLILRRHQVGAAQEHAAGLVGPSVLGAALQHVLQRLLKVLAIAGAVLVEDDEIEGQPFGAQVFVGLEQIAEERQLGPVGESRQQDGVSPEMPYFQSSGWPWRFAWDGVGGAQPRIGIQQASGETLEEDGVIHGQAEVAQLDLTVRAGQRQCPGDGAPVVVLSTSGARLLPRTPRSR